MGLRSGSLLCDKCWGTVFLFDSFQSALAAKDSSDPSSGYSYTTQTWQEIEDGENRGCNWCDILFGEIPVWYRHRRKKEWPMPEETFQVTVRFESLETQPHMVMKVVIQNDWPPVYQVHCDPDDNAAAIVTGRDLVWQVASPRSYKLASECLAECTLHHSCPKPQQRSLPTRVVDCSDSQKPKLLFATGLRGFYATLSYVWGESQPHSVCTGNINMYLEGIDIRTLPQTIKDAIECTHKLNLRYLWTDTLCILQDSADDKRNEIARMCDIYQDAYVTIIAASAQKVSQGFLQDRPDPVTTDLPFWCPDGKLGTISVREGESAPRKEPVNQRAWCFQERLLSPRALIYASHTLQYQCQARIDNIGNACNYFPLKETDELRLPNMMLTRTYAGSLSKEDSRTLHKAWRDILSEYTRRALTDPTDKLIAISGTAQLFQRCWGVGSRYIAGLWEHNLSGDLLWYRRSSSGETLPIPKIYRAPSWSWAATNGCINAGPEMKTDNIIWEICTCEAIPTIGSQCFGQIIGGKLEVKAIVKSVVWDPEEAELYELKQPEMKGNQAGLRKDGSQRHVGYVYLDGHLNSDSEGAANMGFAIVVGSSNTIGERVKHLSGLLIVPADHTVGVFRRIGMFNANGTV